MQVSVRSLVGNSVQIIVDIADAPGCVTDIHFASIVSLKLLEGPPDV